MTMTLARGWTCRECAMRMEPRDVAPSVTDVVTTASVWGAGRIERQNRVDAPDTLMVNPPSARGDDPKPGRAAMPAARAASEACGAERGDVHIGRLVFEEIRHDLRRRRSRGQPDMPMP